MCHCPNSFTSSYDGSPVHRDKSRNSICIVVTSLVELSGDHLGECAIIVAKFTSEYGMPDGEFSAGISRLPKSICKSKNVSQYIQTNKKFQFPRTDFVRYIWSPVKWNADSKPPRTRIVTSNKFTSRLTSNFK